MDTFSSLFSTSYDDMDETSSLFTADDEKSGLWVLKHINKLVYWVMKIILLQASFLKCIVRVSRNYFTITAEIYARSLVNFYCQHADRHMNLKCMRRVSEREREIRQFVIVKIASCIHSYFDNVMMKFMVNNRTDAYKTDVNLLNWYVIPSSLASVRLASR